MKGLLGCSHSAVDISLDGIGWRDCILDESLPYTLSAHLIALGHLADLLARCRIVGGKGFARNGINEFIVDKQLQSNKDYMAIIIRNISVSACQTVRLTWLYAGGQCS